MTRGLVARVAAAVALAVAIAPLPGGVAQADAIRDAQWHLPYLDIATAHQLTRGDGVTVAVIDSGVDASHPDLQRNLLPGVDLIDPDNADAWTPEAHGTGVAGVIAGHGHGPGGGDGVLGIAPAASILPIRVSTDDEHQPTSNLIADAIEEAVAAGASIVNISLSTGRVDLDERAVAAARRNDVVVVAAAGNMPDAEAVTFPAALPGAVAVGATDQAGSRAEFSVTGPELALAAPGTDIVTTGINQGYVRASGTSVAAPIVAGAAALVRARFPDLSADEVVHRLISTATDEGTPGHNEEYGHGIVNVVAALTADVPAWRPEDPPDDTRLAQWHLDFLDLATAHEITLGSGVTVALIDTGVDATHPDLHRNVLPGIDLVDPGNDNAWTAATNGTALAGLIAGHGNRLFDHEPGNRGVLGVAPGATLLPVRTVDPDRSVSENIDLAVAGIIWAAENGADVIVYAAGAAGRARFAEAIEAVRAADAVLVAAAGDQPDATAIGYPGADPSVIAAAGIDRDGTLAEFSVTGPEVSLAAPAAEITTSGLRHGYTEGSSTSLAAAIVAGAAALVRAHHPDLSAEEVVHRLVTTAAAPAGGTGATPGSDGHDEGYGHGVLDVVAALTAEVPPLLPPGGDRVLPLEPDFRLVAAAVLAAALLIVTVGATVLLNHRRRVRRRQLSLAAAWQPQPWQPPGEQPQWQQEPWRPPDAGPPDAGPSRTGPEGHGSPATDRPHDPGVNPR
jgi:type VII secretion-associated serine protease mycosin